MIPINPPEEYGYLVEVAKNQPEYQTLPVRFNQGAATSLWQLTNEERQAIADGKNLFLEMLTFGHPLQPVHLWIDGLEDD